MTLTVHRIGAGEGYRYYTRMVPSGAETRRPGEKLADYYARSGTAPGVWLGRGAPSMDVTGVVAEEQLANLLGLGLHPNTGDQLGTRYRIFATVEERIAARVETLSQVGEVQDKTLAAITAEEQLKGERQAVAGFDLTFSPVKSISVAWGLAATDVAEQILAAHRFAVTSTIGWLEDEVVTARAGADGIAHIDVSGVTVAGFEHRTSRAGDPDLHTHAVMSNKVLATLHDGTAKWLTLDSRSLYKATVTASERYNRVLAEEVTRRLGWQFAVRADQDLEAISPIRELKFMPTALIAGFSKRRAQVEAGYVERVTAYRLEHGHEPPRHVQFALAQDACLATRPDKDLTFTPESERQAWAEFAASIVTPTERQRLHDALSPGLTGAGSQQLVERLDEATVTATVARVLDQMEQRRSDWTTRHLTSAAHRLTADVTFTTDVARDRERARIVTAASQSDPQSERVSEPELVGNPGKKTRGDGIRVWDAPASARFTTHRVLDAEADLLAGARENVPAFADRPSITRVLADHALATDQAAAVEQITLADRRIQLLVGPAGTGKTTTMRALVQVWQRAVGGPVSGLAPTAVAAGVLRDETGMDSTATIDLWATRRAYGLRSGSFRDGELVIVDEAGMAGTLVLAEVLTAAREDGAHVLLVGDPRQLAAIDAGGALRLIQHDVGAAQLHTVWRFSDTDPHSGKRVVRQWEADASLQLRVGDHAAIPTYIEHGRVHDGTRDHALDQLYTAWLHDVEAGRDAIMIAGDNTTVQTLSTRARSDRIAAGLVDTSNGVGLHNGATASIGDIIVTRRNDRSRLRVGGTDFVKNGDLWTVGGITAKGGQMVSGRTGRITLPPDYVAVHVELGYAVTVHRAQGVTVDAAHTLADDSLTRETLYVAATRGRTSNDLYCVTEHLLDAEAERPADLDQPAIAVLTRALDRTEASESATQGIRDEQHRAASTRTHLTRWQYITDHLEEPVGQRAVTAALPAWAARQLLEDPGWPDLGRYLEWVGADDAEQLVRRTWNTISTQHSMGAARSIAAVLLTRLARDHASTVTDGDWLPRPFTRTDGDADLDYGNRLLAAARERAAHLGHLAADEPPVWAAALGPVPTTEGLERDAWMRRAGNLAAYREAYDIHGHGPLGPRPEDTLQRLAWSHALTALHPATAAADRAPADGARHSSAAQSPAPARPLPIELPYLHLSEPVERRDAIRADVLTLQDQIHALTGEPGQPGRHQQAWFTARGRDLRARFDYLQPVLDARDDAAAVLAQDTGLLDAALAGAARYNDHTNDVLDADPDLFLAKTNATWQVTAARAQVQDSARILTDAEVALDRFAQAGPPSPAGPIVRRTDIETERFLAASMDIDEVNSLRDRLTQLSHVLYRAEQAAERYARHAAPAPGSGTDLSGAAPEVGVLATITDALLLAHYAVAEQHHDSCYRTIRRTQDNLASTTARITNNPDQPGPREQRVLGQMTEWTAVLHRLAIAYAAEAHADSTEQHYVTLADQYPAPRADGITALLAEARDTAILARADAYRDNRGLPDDQGARDEMRHRARAALNVLTDKQRTAAADDRSEPAQLTEELIDGAGHLRAARSRLDQVAAELNRRGLTVRPETAPWIATGSSTAPETLAPSVIDDEHWRRTQPDQQRDRQQTAEYGPGR